MKKPTFTLLFLALFQVGFLGAQNNPALPEGPELLETNPAGIGLESQEGMGGYLVTEDGTTKASHFEAIGHFSGYNYHWTPNGVTYSLGFGAGWGPDRLAGGLTWTTQIGASSPGIWKYGLASRPFNFLSLGATGEFLDDQNISARGGVALRPLAFYEPLSRILTLDAAGSWNINFNHAFQTPLLDRVGLNIRPMEGLSLGGYYNPQLDSYQLVGKIWTERTSGSYETTVDTWTKDKMGFWYAFQPKESLFRLSPSGIVRPQLPGLISEWSAPDWLGQRGPNWRQIQEELLALGKDPDVKGIFFDTPVNFASGALAWEFGTTLNLLRSQGKKIYWYLESPSLSAYMVAAWTGDEVVLTPAGSLLLTGLGTQQLYWKDFLATWGIQMHNLKISPYKSAYDTLSESGRSKEDRETWAGLLEEWKKVYTDSITQGRKEKLKEPAADLLAKGPFWSAQEALSLGLVDRVAYKDEYLKILKESSNTLNVYAFSDSGYQRPYRDNWAHFGQKKIGLVWFSGDITEAQSNMTAPNDIASLAAVLRQVGEDTSIQGVVLRVDSPGGSMLASDLIAREITLIKNKGKPIFVSMAGVAGSGGYYIAAPGSKIFATPLTLTGSIGVVSLVPDLTGLLNQQKITSDLVATSPNAGLGNPFLPFTQDREASFRRGLEGAYDQFLGHVSRNRSISLDELKPLAGGRLWSAQGALDHKLIDQVGGLSETLNAMKVELGGGDLEIVDYSPGTATGIGALLGILSPKATALPAPLSQAVDYYTRVETLGTGTPLFWVEPQL